MFPIKLSSPLIVAATLLISCASCMAASAAAGQPEKAAPQSQLQRFTTLYEMWSDVDGNIKKVIADYRAAPPERRQSLFEEYKVLVGQSRKLLPDLRQAAVACYQEAPNENKKIVQVLIGIMANDNRQGQYQEAEQLGKLLQEKQCPDQAYLGQLGAALFCLAQYDEANKLLLAAQQAGGELSPLAQSCLKEMKLREAEAKADDLPRVRLQTSKGDVVLELFENEAPNTVANFISLVEKSFYNGLTFHRVLDDFMAQGGCPDGNGQGGPDYKIPCECYQKNRRPHFRGSLAMAHAGRDTGGSQFYLTFRRTNELDGRHTVFGRVLEGMEVVDQLQRIDPQRPEPGLTPDKIVAAEVIRKRDHEYQPTKVAPSKAPPTTAP